MITLENTGVIYPAVITPEMLSIEYDKMNVPQPVYWLYYPVRCDAVRLTHEDVRVPAMVMLDLLSNKTGYPVMATYMGTGIWCQ